MAVPSSIQLTDNQFDQFLNRIVPNNPTSASTVSKRNLGSAFTLLTTGAAFTALSQFETWSWFGEKAWQAAAYTANALWMHYLGSLIYNSGSYVNRWMQNLGLLPIQKLPDTDIGKISIGGIKLPDWSNQKSFLSGFKQITTDLASSIENFSNSLSDSTAKVFYVSGSACLSLYILYSGLKMGFKYAEKKLIDPLGRPVLSKTYKMDDRITHFYNYFMAPIEWASQWMYSKKPSVEKLTPIFNAKIEKKMEEMIQSIQLISQTSGVFYNVLLWGPPGTGKTMGAEYIADKMGVNFIEISGGDIAKFMGSNQHPVALIDQVFSRMNASDRPVILFIDELDAIGLDRSRLDPSRIEILNALLNHTGSPSKKIILMGATNRPEDLDAALLSRFSEKWHITPPEKKERLEMLRMYVYYFFKEAEDLKVFTPELLGQLNEVLEGQTGRSIHALLNKWLLKKHKNLRLSKEMILKATLEFLEDQKELQKVFANKG